MYLRTIFLTAAVMLEGYVNGQEMKISMLPGFEKFESCNGLFCWEEFLSGLRVLFRMGYAPLGISVIDPLHVKERDYHFDGLDVAFHDIRIGGVAAFHDLEYLVDKENRMIQIKDIYSMRVDCRVNMTFYNNISITSSMTHRDPELTVTVEQPYEIIERGFAGTKEQFLIRKPYTLKSWYRLLPASFKFEETFYQDIKESAVAQEWLRTHDKEAVSWRDRFNEEMIHEMLNGYFHVRDILNEHFPARVLHDEF